MEENKIYKNIILYTLLTSICLSIISFLLFKDIKICLGILIGSIARIIGFLMIIENSKSIIESGKVNHRYVTGYISRLIVYGIIIVSVIFYKINVFSLILGLSIINIIIFVTRKGGILNGND